MKYDKILFERFFEDWSKMPVKKLKSIIKVKAKTILPSLESVDFSKKLRVKLGIDATGTDLHIGHLCPIFVLNIFLKSGHHIDLIIGDFTTKVGDPSGRVTERAILTDEQIAKNFSSYKEQVSKYVEIGKVTVRHNSEWLGKMTVAEALAVQQRMNLAMILQREDFRTRLEAGGLTLAEVCYGMLQGLDSVALESDIELGGNDQLLNLQQAREIQRMHNQAPEVIITNPLLEGTDGRKMSKSYGNYVALNASAEDKFGKLMSVADDFILQYFKSFAYLYEEEIADLEKAIKENPMELKKQLATYFVAIEARSLDAGLAERAKFENKFSKKELSADDFQTIDVAKGTLLIDAIFSSGKFASRGELKRLLGGNAIRNLSDNTVLTDDIKVEKSIKLKVGKLNFFSLAVKGE